MENKVTGQTNKVTGQKKQTQGRRKIEIKKIENVSHRHVAFSKRRLGLFNKASELCILCGTQVLAIVESYGGKRVFTFGHPSADAVIDRFLSNGTRPENEEWSLPEVEHYHRACQELAAEKKENERIKEEVEGGVGPWWDQPIEEMGLTELQEFAAAIEELKNKAAARVEELNLAEAAAAAETAALIMDNNIINNNTNNDNNNLSCSLLPCSSSTSEMLMMNNNNDIMDDYFGLVPYYDNEYIHFQN